MIGDRKNFINIIKKKIVCLNYATFCNALFYNRKSITNSSTIPMIGGPLKCLSVCCLSNNLYLLHSEQLKILFNYKNQLKFN